MRLVNNTVYLTDGGAIKKIVMKMRKIKKFDVNTGSWIRGRKCPHRFNRLAVSHVP